MHILSDNWTALAYFSAPLWITGLFFFRRNVATRSLAVLIIAFLLACGLTHIVEFFVQDAPMKSLQAAVELMAAALAIATCMLLWSPAFNGRALPRPIDLAEENAGLKATIDRQAMNADFMRRAYEEQEQQVATATKALRLAYAKLDANRERLAFALDGANDGLWDWTFADKSIYFSARLAEMLGHEDEDMTMSSDARWALIHQDDRARALKAFDAHLEGKTELYESEHRLRGRDGRHLWVLDRGKVVTRDHLGRAVRAVGTTADISRRKSAEAALQASHRKIGRLYEHTPALLYSVDEDGRLLTVTRKWLEMMGYRKEEVLGRRSIEFMSEESRRDIAETVLPEFRAKGRIADVPCRMVKKSGEVFDASLSATSEYDRDGRVVRSLAVLVDVTERNRALRLAEENKARLLLALEGAREGLWDWNVASGDLYLSPKASSILGFTPASRPHDISFWQGLLPVEDRKRFTAGLRDLSQGRVPSLVSEQEIHPSGGDSLWIEWRASSVGPTESVPGRRIIGIFRDITARKRAELQTAYRALHDGLTGLPNRVSFEEQLQRAHAEAGLTGRPLAVMFLDLDRFKAVNDSFGHDHGDQLLVEVGRRLQGCLRKSDLVARFGGDEFAILAKEYKKAHHVSLLADRIIQTLGQPFRIKNQDMTIGVSIGITSYPEDRSPAEVLVANADLALYRAKQSGRGGWQRYHPGMPTRRRHQPTASDAVLYDALKNGEFEVLCQPTINIGDLSIRALSATTFWHHPVRGSIRADHFVDEMLNSPFLRHLVEWSLTSATEQFATWRDLGLPSGIALTMAIPTPLLHAHNLADSIERMLQQIDLEPALLTLEITENALSEAIVASGMLQKLHAKGFGLAIDDFGKDASPLGILNSLPVEQLNIHAPLISCHDDEKRSQALARAIVAIADNLGMASIAKEINTADQLVLANELGCTAVRGALFQGPASAIDITHWLSRWQDRCHHDQTLDLLRHG